MNAGPNEPRQDDATGNPLDRPVDVPFDYSSLKPAELSQPPATPPGDAVPRNRWAAFWSGVPNPFYIISAALFVHGTVLPAEEPFSPATQVLLSLAYVALCVMTTVWLVRRLGRWDDARSLIVIVTGMFLAISLELDDGLALVTAGLRWAIVGGVLAAAVMAFETIRIGCRVSLPRSFLVAFYSQWVILLFAPAAMSVDVTIARIQIALFAIIAAASWLLYWPALGRCRVDANVGWSAPLCPWLIAWLTGGATLVRLYFLSISFDAVPDVLYAAGEWNWQSILGFDFAVPFLLAIGLLLAESGRRARHLGNGGLFRGRTATVLVLTAVVAVVAPVPEGVAVAFRETLATSFDVQSTLMLTTIAVLSGLWFRRNPWSDLGWVTATLAGGWALTETNGSLADTVGIGLVALGVCVALLAGFRNRRPLFWTIGVAGVYVGLFRNAPADLVAVPWRIPEMSAVVLFLIGTSRFNGIARDAFASATMLAWSVMLFPMLRDTLQGPLPLLHLGVCLVWITAAIPFVIRFYHLALVPAAFYLVVVAIGLDLAERLLIDPNTGKFSIRRLTLCCAAGAFLIGVAISREKTRRERLQEAYK